MTADAAPRPALSAPDREPITVAVDNRAQRLRELALEARDRKIAELFDPDRIVADATRVSALGFTSLRYAPGEPVPGARTSAAGRRVESRLRALGFEVRWDTLTIGPNHKGNPTGFPLECDALVVAW